VGGPRAWGAGGGLNPQHLFSYETYIAASDQNEFFGREALLDAIKEAGLDVNPEKTKYMLRTRSQNIGQKIRA
jgi:hypothetical protein